MSKHKHENDGKDGHSQLTKKSYEREIAQLQIELCHLQTWVQKTGQRAMVIFEGRDAAGKGGVIKRITERVSPRVFRIAALPAPSDREKSQLYMQRYIQHFPAAGETVLFDRSWYNRAGVERVMGFCTNDEYERFLHATPELERNFTDQGIKLIKYFFDVSQEEQEKRFLARMDDERKQWKLSPMDIESWRRWWDYTAAYARMIDSTDSEWAPWYRVLADNKKRARLNCISHLLSMFPYEKIPYERPEAGKRHERKKGTPDTIPFKHDVPAVY